MGVTAIGIVHPGAMGSAVGAVLSAGGGVRLWASDGRSSTTRERAEAAGLTDAGSLEKLAERADAVVSVCPPAAAIDVARSMADAGFTGLYVDANAIAPATTRRIAAIVTDAGARFVDGGIVGRPPHTPGTTRLYLSGPDADDVAGWFRGTALEAIVVGDAIGAASAVKAAYAGWTKGSAALLLATRALARAEGVEDLLLDEWTSSQPDVRARSDRQAAQIHHKAWRFAGELRELAIALEDAGLPSGFHAAAAEVYERLSGTGDAPGERPVADVLDDLLRR